MAARNALSSGGCENFTYTRVPPRKSTPYGMWCQNNIEKTPATLNTREKARKYHFLPRKSMLVLRKNSKRKLQVSKFQGFKVQLAQSGVQLSAIFTLKPLKPRNLLYFKFKCSTP